jgi:hypothetical protein
MQAKEGEFVGATLTMHDEVFVQLVSGEMDAMMALLRGKVMLTGSKKQAAKLQALFQSDHDGAAGAAPTSLLGMFRRQLTCTFGAAAGQAPISPDIAVKQHSAFFMRFLVRCAFFNRNPHSRMPLVPTPARLKRAASSEQAACDQWHSSRKFTLLPVDIVIVSQH